MHFDVFYKVHDDVVTEVFRQFMPQNSHAAVFVQAAAIRPDNGVKKRWYKSVSYTRGVGAPSVTSATDIMTPVGDGGAAAWDLTFGVVGNNAVVNVTGQNGATTGWQISIEALFMLDNL